MSLADPGDLGHETRHHARPSPRRQTIPPSKYLNHYVVGSPGEARVLSKQAVWDILDYVRASGGKGAPAGEISKVLNIPASDVYTLLRELSRYGYVFPVPRDKVPRGERKKRYVYDGVTWKRYRVENKLERALQESSELKLLVEDLGGALFRGLAQVREEFRKNSQELLPAADPSQFCPKCGLDHEAIEFFHGISLAALTAWEATHLRELLTQLGYLR